MESEPLPRPVAAETQPPTPDGRQVKKRLTSAARKSQIVASACAIPGAVTRTSRPSPTAWSSSPERMASTSDVFPWALEPVIAKTSLLFISRPVIVSWEPARVTSIGSSSAGQIKGMCTPFFGPVTRYQHRSRVMVRAGRVVSPIKQTRFLSDNRLILILLIPNPPPCSLQNPGSHSKDNISDLSA